MYYCCPFKLYYPCYTGCPLNFGNEICGRYRSATFQAILAVLGHLLLKWSDMCKSIQKVVFCDLSFRNTRKKFFKLISEGNPVGLLWSKASESRGLQIDFGSIHHRIGVVINRREHDMIAFWFNLEHDVSVTTDGASTDVYFNPTFFYGLSPYSTYSENEKATFKMVKSHTRGLLKIFAKGFPIQSAL